MHARAAFVRKQYVTRQSLTLSESESGTGLDNSHNTAAGELSGAPALKKFRFLTSKLTPATSTTAPNTRDSVAVKLAKYIQELDGLQANTASPLDFWADRRAVYPRLTPVAEDLVAAPASQAYIEHIF